MNYVHTLTGNHILNVALIAWFVAQLFKVILNLIFERKLDWTRMVGAGGMPSSHSAIVVSLAVSVGKVCGTYSPEFAIAVVLALVVMYDASGVRRAAGEQAKVLNYMMDHWVHGQPDLFQNDLKELLGHTPMEVLAGAILGGVIGWLA